MFTESERLKSLKVNSWCWLDSLVEQVTEAPLISSYICQRKGFMQIMLKECWHIAKIFQISFGDITQKSGAS